MNTLTKLKDSELLSLTKVLVQRERALTLEVLNHLAEIERRKLFAELKYSSLFEYAVRELGYSEAAASRRIQAMRLVREIPDIEAKIESGALNLSNICQASRFFREMKKAQPEQALNTEQKKELLSKLENKSAREAEKLILTMTPPEVLPRERERIISPEHIELRMVITESLKAKLDEVRSLLGPRGTTLSLAELVTEMAALSAISLKEKRFGKRRVSAQNTAVGGELLSRSIQINQAPAGITQNPDVGAKATKQMPITSPNPDVGTGAQQISRSQPNPAAGVRTRHIPRAIKHAVWHAAQGRCAACGSTHNLQFDHVQPFSLGGDSTPENIQLLCHSCNLRRGVSTFGATAMRRA